MSQSRAGRFEVEKHLLLVSASEKLSPGNSVSRIASSKVEAFREIPFVLVTLLCLKHVVHVSQVFLLLYISVLPAQVHRKITALLQNPTTACRALSALPLRATCYM